MKEQEAIEIMQIERLTRVNWYDENNLKENEVGIRKIRDGWEVYITGERASVVNGTESKFANSDEAYDALIKKAKYLQKLYG